MHKLDHFEDTQHALERGLWTRRQTDAIFDVSQKAIEQSMRVMRDAQRLTSRLSEGAQ